MPRCAERCCYLYRSAPACTAHGLLVLPIPNEIINGSDRGLWLWPGQVDGPEDSDWSQDMVQRLGDPALADLDGDGLLDAMIVDDEGWLTMRRGAGDGRFASPAALVVEGTELYDFALGDLDGDARRGIVVASGSGLDFYGSAVAGLPFEHIGGWGGADSRGLAADPGFAIGDLDGDGDLDLVKGSPTASHRSPRSCWAARGGIDDDLDMIIELRDTGNDRLVAVLFSPCAD